MGVLVATQRFAIDSIDVREPVDPTPHEHGVNGRWLHAESPGDLDGPSR